ncbi:MAG: metallophosphoesterase [Planctomycetota bacterium]
MHDTTFLVLYLLTVAPTASLGFRSAAGDGRGRRLRLGLGVLACVAAVALAGLWASGAAAWGVGPRRLATPPADIAVDAGRPWRVAVIGDIQNGLSELSELLALVARLEPDVILLLGDTVNNATPGRYAVLHSMFRDYGPAIPLVSVPGNHDMRRSNDALDLYETWVGPLHWRLDVGGWRILGLDNAAGPLSAASLELAAAAHEPPPKHGLVVATHRPLREALPRRPTITLAGHVHSSDDFVDEWGTRHFHHGNNCDRSHDNRAEDLPTVGILTLAEDGFEWTPHTVPRAMKLGVEFRRVACGSVYPVIRSAPFSFGFGIASLLAVGVGLLVGAAPFRARPSAGGTEIHARS